MLLFDYTFVVLYNLLFTSLPIMFMGAFDQDVDAKTSMQFPALYLRGIKQKHFTRSKFWLYVLDALYQSVICFFIPWYLSNDVYASGRSTNDLVALGTLISACSVVVANLYVGLNMFHWTKMIFTVIFGSIVVFFLYCWVYANFFTIENTFYGMDDIILNSPPFWFAIALSVILTMLPHYVYKFARQYLKPNDIIIVREQLYREKHPSKKERRARKLKAMAIRESEMNGTTSSFQDPGLTSNHVLGDDDLEDDDLDQVPVIRHSPTILSPEDPNEQKPGDIRQRQPSPSPMSSLNKMDEAYHLKVTSDGSGVTPSSQLPQRELTGRRRVVSNNNAATGPPSTADQDGFDGVEIATPAAAFKKNNAKFTASSTSLPMNPDHLQPDSLEPSNRTFAQGYPTTSFSFNQDFINAASVATGGLVGGSPASDRPRVKRQSTPSIPVGGPNFRFMGNDAPVMPGAPTSHKAGHTGFAFSTDDASAFVYSHLNRVHSASNDERTTAAKVKRASQMYYGSRNSIDGSEFGSGSFGGSGPASPVAPGASGHGPFEGPFDGSATSSPPPLGDTTAVDSYKRESLSRRPRGLSRSITSPDVPVAELGAMLLQQQKEMEQGMERLSKAQASVRAAAQQRQSIQKVRFQGTSDSLPDLGTGSPSVHPPEGQTTSSSSATAAASAPASEGSRLGSYEPSSTRPKRD